MLFISSDGILALASGLPYMRAGRVYKSMSFVGGGGGGGTQVDAIADMEAVDIFKDKASISWTKPSNATGFVLQRATNIGFTANLTTLYTGSNQWFDDTTLAEHTVYYYRVKGTAAGLTDSDWKIISFKTFFTPWAWSNDPAINPAGRAGNRFANATDVAFYGGNVNVGDFIIVGWDQGGNGGDWGVGVGVDSLSYGAFASPANKVVAIGDRGYDWIAVNMDIWEGISGTPRIITNSGGQIVCNNFDLADSRYVTFTGKYDAAAKTGDAAFRGLFATDWKKLGRSFGWYFKGKWSDTTHFGFHCSGKCSHTIVEGVEAGEGNYVSASVKNDGFALRKAAQPGIDQNYSIPNTGAGSWTTLTVTDAYFSADFDQVRAYGISGDTKLNWIEFENQSTHVVTRYEAESFNGNLRTSSTPTDDVGGGFHLQGLTAGNSADYAVTLSKGTYTVRVRVSASVSGGTLQIRTGSTVFDGFEFRYNYLHDTRGGENMYIGSTQPDPQQPFINMKVHHNLFVRAGLNALQTGQMVGGGNEIYNNVMMASCFAWTSAFALFQDQSVQQSTRSNGFKFYGNIVTGGGESMVNYFMLQKEPLVSTLPTEFYNNAFLNSNGYQCFYINTKDPYGGLVRVNGNVIGRQGTASKYRILYPWQTGPINHSVTFESSHDPVFSEASGIATLECNNNITDFSVSAGTFAAKQGDMANLTIVDGGNNIRQATVPYPQWSNFMDLPNTYLWETIESWTGRLSPGWDGYFNGPGTHAETVFCNDTITIPTSHPTSKVLNVVMNTPRPGGIGPHPGYFVGEGILVQSFADPSKYFWGIVTNWAPISSITGTLTINTLHNVGTGTFAEWRVYGARSYDLNQIVFHDSRYYKSKIANNIGHVPVRGGDANWEMIIFSNGSVRPIDDLRLSATDYYHLRGMGTGFTV